MSAALPPIDNAFLPADVRNGTKERRQQYDAALSFERQLVGELTKQLSKTAQPADGSQGSAATQTYRDMLPGAMADAVMAEGGLGLAAQIDKAISQEGTS